jgi:hypothetical protein
VRSKIAVLQPFISDRIECLANLSPNLIAGAGISSYTHPLPGCSHQRKGTNMTRLPKATWGIVLGLVLAILAAPLEAQRVGGYVYNKGEDRFIRNVYNFIKHFNYEQYYWSEAYMFTAQRANYVDRVNLAYYSGHGNNYQIGMGPGASVSGVDLRTAGGYGQNLRWIIFQSCAVVPSVPDRSNWWGAWVPNGIFQGLHQAIGYRTVSYSDNGISNNFGSRVRGGQSVWQSWFTAVNDERSFWRGASYPGDAAVMLYPGKDNDTLYSFGSRPPAGHTNLRTYYQY